MSVELIEAAYRLDLDRSAQLEEVLRAAAQTFGEAGRVAAWFFEHAPDLAASAQVVVTERGAEDLVKLVHEAGALLTPASRSAMMLRPGVGSSTEVLGRRGARELLLPHGLADDTMLICPAGDMRGIVVGATFETLQYYTRRQKHLLELAARHLAAGWRLRLSLEAGPVPESIIFTPDGRHVHGALLEASRGLLRDIVLRRERAKSSAGREDQLSVWDELLDGRWILVDRFESDGKRYVVAFQNLGNLSAPPVSPLAQRALKMAVQGTSNKSIALELGLGEPRVTRIIEQALSTVRFQGLNEALLLSSHAPQQITQGEALNLSVWEFEARESALQQKFAKLSEAERAVVLSVLEGLRRAQIANERHTSVKTVDAQLKNAFAKLGVASRRELMLFAART